MPIGLGTAILGAGALGAGASIWGSMNAADAQRDAANKSIGFQQDMFNKGQENTQPFRAAGTDAWKVLSNLLGVGEQQNDQFGLLTKAFNPTDLENTPGYKFTQSEGLKALQNSFAAKGQAGSGNLLKGGADYVNNLAQTTYGNEFNRDMATKKSIYDMLFGPTQLGANAATQNANQSMQLGQNVGATMVGAGNAQAAGYNAIGGTINNALTTGAQQYANYSMYQPLIQAQTDYLNTKVGGPGGTAGVTNPLLYGTGGVPVGQSSY